MGHFGLHAGVRRNVRAEVLIGVRDDDRGRASSKLDLEPTHPLRVHLRADQFGTFAMKAKQHFRLPRREIHRQPKATKDFFNDREGLRRPAANGGRSTDDDEDRVVHERDLRRRLVLARQVGREVRRGGSIQ